MSNSRATDEAKKGSAEVVILAIVERESHHGYEIAKLIEQRSAGSLKFTLGLSTPPVSHGRPRVDQGTVDRKGRAATPLSLSDH